VERIAALLHEEETGEPWTVAGVEHPGPDRDYYRRLASKVAALAQQPAAVDEAMVFRLAVWMAEHDGCEDPYRLIYEGSPPVPWGEVWNLYEYDARAALTAALVTKRQEPAT
jgi:hypothetical protein